MQSRYDFFDESVVIDNDGQSWPDPLTIDYNTGRLTKLPVEQKITSRDLTRFWTLMYEKYNISYYDDLLLNENGIPYVMMLKPGDILLMPAFEDIEGFITNKQIGYEA
jgi:hypothetical protein